MLLTWLSVTGMVVGPVLRPAVSLLASPRHASPCAVDRVDRATAVRLGAAAVVGVAPGVGVAPAVAAASVTQREWPGQFPKCARRRFWQFS